MSTQDTGKTGADALRTDIEKQQAQPIDPPITPIPIPIRLPNSGLYISQGLILNPSPLLQASEEEMTVEAQATPEQAVPVPVPGPAIPIPVPFRNNEELRLDVDGFYPQMKASGRIANFRLAPAHWIANVAQIAPNTYQGAIWYKEGNSALIPQTTVRVEVTRGLFGPTSARVTFSGGGPTRIRTFQYRSRYFHPVSLEFDVAQGVTATTTYQTHSHPTRPATLPNENLGITTVFRRTGFEAAVTGGQNSIPIAAAGANARWSDNEMHDAMQVHWSQFGNISQWALWTLFASLHEQGTGLGGIMFDDIGPNHRQGTSLFVDSFIKNPPNGDPAPAAWVNRMIFWTAVHEMGHAFNLAHSWQKHLGTPWIPLASEPNARSFMNYPFNVPGGVPAFFGDFEFRFSDQELLFMRHAPFRFVQQGNADWFDHHGFQEARISPEPKLSLRIEPPRASNKFEFLEPIVLTLRLRNTSGQPQLLDSHVLASGENLTVVIKKQGKPARELTAYAQRCWQESKSVLAPNQEIADTLFLSAGTNGWDIAEPGNYTVQVALHLEEEDVISEPLKLRVTPPQGRDAEVLAQDVISDEVGRVLAFDGTQCQPLQSANNHLRAVIAKMPDSKAATHARVAVAAPIAQDYKRTTPKDGRHTLEVAQADYGEARQLLSALNNSSAAETLSAIDYEYYCKRFASVLGETKAIKAGRAK